MHLVVVSTYPPRRCGLATFAADVRAALGVGAPHWRVDVCALDRDGLTYGPEVTEVLAQDRPEDYRRAARAVAATRPDLVLIQHEYGIFGGPQGSDVCAFTDELRAHGVPYALTLHTVLAAPGPQQRSVLADLCRHAARITCFTESSRRIVIEAGVADPARTVVMPHGVPASLTAALEPAQVGSVLSTALTGLGSSRMLSTFGLLRPGKGLEMAIRAMPWVVARHPDVRYLVAGATHPEVIRASGEAYRDELVTLAAQLGVSGHVQFVDAFLTELELAALLQRTELHLTPYRSPLQTCSGVLTFALAAGCPVVSTPYAYAVDMLTPPDGPERGVLVPFDDPESFAGAILALLEDRPRLAAARAAASEFGASLTWPAVGVRLADLLLGAVARPRAPAPVLVRPAALGELVNEAGRLPPIAPALEATAASVEIGT